MIASPLSVNKPAWLAKLDPSFHLEPIQHKYWLNGVMLPGITGMLKGCGYVDVEWMKPSARIRGSEVHKAIHYLNEGDLDWDSVPRGWAGYVHAYVKLGKDWNIVPELCEVPLYHPGLGFAGTADIVGKVFDNVPAIIEIKTGPIKKWVPLQTIAQDMLLRPWEPGGVRRRRWAVQLNEDGTYKPSPEFTDYATDEAQFLNIISTVRGRDRYGDKTYGG